MLVCEYCLTDISNNLSVEAAELWEDLAFFEDCCDQGIAAITFNPCFPDDLESIETLEKYEYLVSHENGQQHCLLIRLNSRDGIACRDPWHDKYNTAEYN